MPFVSCHPLTPLSSPFLVSHLTLPPFIVFLSPAFISLTSCCCLHLFSLPCALIVSIIAHPCLPQLTPLILPPPTLISLTTQHLLSLSLLQPTLSLSALSHLAVTCPYLLSPPLTLLPPALVSLTPVLVISLVTYDVVAAIITKIRTYLYCSDHSLL
jgi:hypothetical protein